MLSTWLLFAVLSIGSTVGFIGHDGTNGDPGGGNRPASSALEQIAFQFVQMNTDFDRRSTAGFFDSFAPNAVINFPAASIVGRENIVRWIQVLINQGFSLQFEVIRVLPGNLFTTGKAWIAGSPADFGAQIVQNGQGKVEIVKMDISGNLPRFPLS